MKTIKKLAKLAVILGILGLIGISAAPTILTAWPVSDEWPGVEEVRKTFEAYELPEQTRIVDADGRVIATIGIRRKHLPYQKIPQAFTYAVIAAEDKGFFTHRGFDWLGIARCTAKMFACGASTIDQQVGKRVFLPGQLRGWKRKLGAMALAPRINAVLSKKQIFELYASEIYLGHGAYGIFAAAEIYFGKPPDQLTLAENALIAGLPPAPARYDPFKNDGKHALRRRGYVLGRMLKEGYIDQAQYKAAMAEPLRLVASRARKRNDAYVERVKTELYKRFGRKRVDAGGLVIHLEMDSELQAQAESALQTGLHAHARRQLMWRSKPRVAVTPESVNPASDYFMQWLSDKSRGMHESQTPVWDFYTLAIDASGTAPRWPEGFKNAMRVKTLRKGVIAGGLVTRVTRREIVVSLGEVDVVIKRKDWRWTQRKTAWRKLDAGKVVKIGQFVLVSVKDIEGRDETSGRVKAQGILERKHGAEGAVVVIETKTRGIRAMVGGYDNRAGGFNRAIMPGVAGRQVGSAFKPFVYAASFATGKYGTTSICLDAPFVSRIPGSGGAWKPQNHGGGFDGPITLMTALAKSKNTCAARFIYKTGTSSVATLARATGITSKLPNGYSMALGTADMRPLEITNAYATFASGGIWDEPSMISQVTDTQGNVLYQVQRQPQYRIPPSVAYLTHDLMAEVVRSGTGQRAKELGCSALAGKTGTTNDSRNAWFVGCSPQVCIGVWTGYDNNDPLSPAKAKRRETGVREEHGGRTALPIWIDTMHGQCGPDDVFPMPTERVHYANAADGTPIYDYGVEQRFIDPKSQGLVAEDDPRAVLGTFLRGGVPTSTAPAILEDGSIEFSPDSFGMDDY